MLLQQEVRDATRDKSQQQKAVQGPLNDSAFRAFARVSARKSLNNNVAMMNWLDAQDRLQERCQVEIGASIPYWPQSILAMTISATSLLTTDHKPHQPQNPYQPQWAYHIGHIGNTILATQSNVKNRLQSKHWKDAKLDRRMDRVWMDRK